MADYPAQGSKNWRLPLKQYIDERPTEEAVEAKIAALSALVVDLAGNPLGTGHVVIKVDTANGNEISDIVWQGV